MFADLHSHIDADDRAAFKDDAIAYRGFEPGELTLHLVSARKQCRRLVIARVIRQNRSAYVRVRVGYSDGNSRQDGVGCVGKGTDY